MYLILAGLGVAVAAYYLYNKSQAVLPALPAPSNAAAIAAANAAANKNNPSVITTVIPSLVTLLDSLFAKKPATPTTVTPTGSYTDNQNYSVNPEYVY